MRRRIQIWLIAGFLVLAVMLNGAEASFSQVNSDSLISLYATKMQKYLDKDSTVSEAFLLTSEGIEVYAPATDTSIRKFEYRIDWMDIGFWKEAFQKYSSAKIIQLLTGFTVDARINPPVNFFSDSSRPLLHYKIALDPGHMAGDIETAKMERKWVEMKQSSIQLIEGELTLATALILRKKLEKEGATVMLTRNKPNQSAFGIGFQKWKDSLFSKSLDSAAARGDVSFEERNFLLTNANNTEIFRRFFLYEEMRERARRINEFNPDLTLIIHYNVDEMNQPWNRPTKKNFNMAFVGGSFGAGELDRPEARIDFLRLLLTEDIENSIEFSKYIVNSLVETLKVPAALDSCAVYLKGNCLTTDVAGVFCRNLGLTRTVRGTMCYGESLYQDNINEYKLLGKKNASTPLSTTIGMKTSKRVEEVAEAYFNGIINYIKNKKRP